jgi:HK97 family phage prohead protease
MERMLAKAFLKQINESERKLVGIASTEVVDRYGDIVKQDGWELDNFMKNPVMLWSHNYSEPPIAKIVSLEVKDGKLVFEAKFPEKGLNELADKVFEMYKKGFLNAFSIGFMPKDYEPNEHGGYTYTRNELLEISAVTVPANQEALSLAVKNLSLESKETIEKIKKVFDELVEKAAVPVHTSEKLDDRSEWDATVAINKLRKWASSDGTGDKDTIDWNKYKYGFAWYDEENKESFSAYKLPHHTVDSNNVLVTVWRGVVAAMGVLMGAMGGVDIPDSDFDKVYNHLAKHYREFDKEPPEKELVLAFRNLFNRVNELEKKIDVVAEKVLDNHKEIEAIKNTLLVFEMALDDNGEEVPEFDDEVVEEEKNVSENVEEENLSEKLKNVLKEFAKEVEKDGRN